MCYQLKPPHSLRSLRMNADNEKFLASNIIKLMSDNVKVVARLCAACLLVFNFHSVRADDELAKYAAEGNSVGVDGKCFFKKCSLETARCGNDPSCLKGLSCLARFVWFSCVSFIFHKNFMSTDAKALACVQQDASQNLVVII